MSHVVAARVGSRLVVRARELRGERTLTDMAARAGIRQDELGKIERGETQAIRFETLLKLCTAFDVSVGELLTVEDAEPSAANPLTAVMAGVRAGTVRPHAPSHQRRRLTDADVFIDPAKASTLVDREQLPPPHRRTHVPAGVTARTTGSAPAGADPVEPQ